MTLPLWSDDGGPGPGTGRGEPRRLTLVRLAGEIARSLSAIGRVAVEGEVHRPRVSRAGRTYFTLRDRASQLPVSCPARAARRCRAVDGERVMVVGQLVWGNDQGQLALEAEEVTPVGEGAVAAMLAEVRARLVADGLIGRPPRPLPLLPSVIGVVCGAEAAVRRDIESVVAARFPGYPVWFEETTVSGPGAAISIVDALVRVASRPGVEAVVLARGGGDATALLPWSDEELCRAVAACRVPVVSAIGHESDRPLCDEVADLRCGTPSIAAHAVVPERAALHAALEAQGARLRQAMAARLGPGREALRSASPGGALALGLERSQRRLRHAGDRLGWAHPAPVAGRAGARLRSCNWRQPMGGRLLGAADRLAALSRHARALSPQQVVARGFAVVRGADGSVVRRPDQVSPGEVLVLTLAHGHLAARALPAPSAGAAEGRHREPDARRAPTGERNGPERRAPDEREAPIG
jgi:exodeoxyribonuclease VII large subunit